MAKISLERLMSFDRNFLLTTDEVCAIDGINVCAGTISKHRHAGLLPFVPGRPIRHRVGDVIVYQKMLSAGLNKRLHRTLVIAVDDRAVYSPLRSITDFTSEKASTIIEAVLKETDALWQRYKAKQAAEKAEKQTPKRKRAA